jgi:5,10-methylenetetrahydromethanopterin reductase
MSVAVRVGACLVGDPVDAWQAVVPTLADSGFAMIGVPDSQSIYPDVHIRAALLAGAPGTSTIGPFVTNPITRDPVVTAGEAAALAALAPGRTFLGIGRGDSALATVDAAPGTVTDIERHVAAVRLLLGTAHRVPVYVAAVGARALRLAGRIGDGVIIGAGIDPATIARSLAHVRAGADDAGRTMADLDIWWYVLAGLAEDDAEADRELRHSLASFANAAFKCGLAGKGVPDRFVPDVRRLLAGYHPMEHAKYGNRRHAALVADPAFRGYLAHRFALCGSPDSVVTQLSAAAAAGATNVWLSVRAADKHRFLRLWATAVAPAVPMGE